MRRWRYTSSYLFTIGLLMVGMAVFGSGSPTLALLGTAMMGVPLMLHRTEALDTVEAPPKIGPAEDSLPSGYTSPEEPVDACEHPDAEAVTVEVDVTGDGEAEVIGWLCSECGAKVSYVEAHRRNYGIEPEEDSPTDYMWGGYQHGSGEPVRPPAINNGETLRGEGLRVALADVVGRIDREAQGWPDDSGKGEFAITEDQYRRYSALVREAQQIKDLIETEQKAEAALIAAGVECEGYIEVEGNVRGSIVRRFAALGECLCGHCGLPSSEHAALESAE